ncbi:MAG: hypothetical protein LBR48_01560 [Dysgonamonadaceae bacterium]|jgi:hypothetical protein|nr:hypothetical protein [Dysgonamonadaceae bacterium]
MDIQLVIVVITGIAVAVIIAVKACRFFTNKDNPPHCPGCSGCEIPAKKNGKLGE